MNGKVNLNWKVVLGCVLAVVAVTVFVWGDHKIQTYKARSAGSPRWPTVAGKIIVSRAEEQVSEDDEGNRSYSYIALITYEYSVNNIPYTSDQLGWDDDGYRSSMTEAQELAKSYPEGKIITVYYDPDNPEFSLLNVTLPERPNDVGVGYFIGSGAILAFAMALVYEQAGIFLRFPVWVMIPASMIIFLGGGILTFAWNVHSAILVGFGFISFLVGGIVRSRQ